MNEARYRSHGIEEQGAGGHARQVTLLAKEVAARLGLLEEEQMLCGVSALLMDIGMIGWPECLIG